MRNALLVAGAVLGVFPVAGAFGPMGPSERERLLTHFATVEQELLARDISSGLTPGQRVARSKQIHRF